jgi:hypothetical protein
MTHLEMKKKVLAMIEEINPDSEMLTDDPDIAAKYNEVTNQVMYELARMKKIPKYVEMAVAKGDQITFESVGEEVGCEVYQFGTIAGVDHVFKANGTTVKILENGLAEIDFYIYPARITTENSEEYVFELSPDCLEIMPYGIAGDLLKSDVSAEYGAVYAQRYETMLQRLDPRYHMTSVYIEGGWSI